MPSLTHSTGRTDTEAPGGDPVAPGKPDPNQKLVGRLLRKASTEHELPDGRPARMQRPEAVTAINKIMVELFPDVDLALINGGLLDERELGRYENGHVHWPSKYRRAAMRVFFDVRSDKELGFYRSQFLEPVLDDQEPARPPAPRSRGEQAPGAPHTSPGRTETLDTTTPHPARVYDHWLGGKDNFAADRAFADAISERFPHVKTAARSNRSFRVRAVRAVAYEGVRQFLDIGTGLPSPGNTHQVAQRVAADARVLYVDNDPLVGTHSRALTVGTPEGRTGYLEADLRRPEEILRDPALAEVLDLGRPVCVVLAAVLHFIPDPAQAQHVVRTLLNAVPSGSFLIISHATLDYASPADAAEYERMYAAGKTVARTRTRKDIESFVTGLELLTPGFVAVSDWRPEDHPDDRPKPEHVSLYGVVGRVP